MQFSTTVLNLELRTSYLAQRKIRISIFCNAFGVKTKTKTKKTKQVQLKLAYLHYFITFFSLFLQLEK